MKAFTDAMDAAAAIAGHPAGSGGGTDAVAGYAEVVARRFDDYLAMRNHFYRIETRWPASPFWQRRRDRTFLRESGEP
jgi:hypothetical protein